MAIGDKLERLIDERHTNVNKLAQSINVSPQTIYGIIKRNNTKVDLNVLQAIADELCVTLDYFADNQAQKDYTFTPLEQEHIRKYRSLDDYGKKAVDMVLDNELFRARKQNVITRSDNEPYTPEVLAASRPNKEMTEADKKDLDSILNVARTKAQAKEFTEKKREISERER